MLWGHQVKTPKKSYRRAGVVPYTIKNGVLYFLLGVDRCSKELTDFGGGVKLRETMLEAAYREFHEESCNILKGVVGYNNLRNSLVIDNSNRDTVTFFVQIPNQWFEQAKTAFEKKHNQLFNVKKYNEMSAVRWVSEKDLYEALCMQDSILWSRFKLLLKQNCHWPDLTTKLRLTPYTEPWSTYPTCMIKTCCR
jgi:ADP-ribose pyrophosphatase YjhB (NUDIX family)